MSQKLDRVSPYLGTGASGMNTWLGILLILLSVDFFPNLPNASLDSSWMNGLTVALAGGAIPGRDLIFTYGPLASMLTAYGGPGFVLGMFMVLAVAANLAVLLRLANDRWFPWAAVVVFLLSPSNEALFYIFLAVIPLAVVRIGAEPLASRVPLIASAILSPALVLAKLSFLPLCAVVLLLSCAYEAISGRFRSACTAPVLFCGALVLLWVLSGQTLGALPTYLLDGEIIKGYTTAMEWDLGVGFAGINLQLLETGLLYLVSAVLVGLFVLSTHGTTARWYMVLAMAAILAVVIKAAVVRHGGVHSIFPWLLICVLSMTVAGITRFPRMPFVICLASLPLTAAFSTIYSGDGRNISRIVFPARDHAVAQGLDWQSVKRSPIFWRSYILSAPGAFFSSLPSPLAGLADRIDNVTGAVKAVSSRNASMKQSASSAREEIKAVCQIQPVVGSVDIYPTDINCLLANELEWRPRPVFQSYSAYTPALLELNRNHIAGDGAPKHLFFAVKPIDERLPVLEEGYSWLCLAERYKPSGVNQGDFLPLDLTGRECSATRETGVRTARLGEVVTLSCDRRQVLASFEFQQTLTGRLSALFYKTRRLMIDVRTCDGETRSYRFVPGMAALPLPLSPLVENSMELRQALFEEGLPQMRRIESFVIREGASESPISGWSPNYFIHWHESIAASR